MLRENLTADQALLTRRSVRAFLPTPVARATVEELLLLAARSPSGTNIQPWKVRVVAGEARERLCGAILASLDRDGQAAHKRDWNYYPVSWREPFLSRRRKIGWDLYGLLGIRKGDFEATERQRRRNFEFFGAPVGLIFTIDARLTAHSWLDLGLFVQNVMIAAKARGIDTCPQVSFARFHAIIASHLEMAAEEVTACGMSLGFANTAEPVNQLRMPRQGAQEFARMVGFEPPAAAGRERSSLVSLAN